MPAKGHRKPNRLSRRLRVSVSDSLEEKIREKAKAAGVKHVEWSRQVLERAVGATNKLSVPESLEQRIREKAKATGLSDLAWIRKTLEHAVGLDSKSSRKRKRRNDLLAHEVNEVGLQLKKIGTNVNQLAKQANNGLVPLTRGEVQYMLNQLQLVFSKAAGVLERATS